MKELFHGLQFAVTALLGLACGYYFDRKFSTSPLGLLAGLFAGAAMGIYNLTRALKKP